MLSEIFRETGGISFLRPTAIRLNTSVPRLSSVLFTSFASIDNVNKLIVADVATSFYRF